MSLEEKWKEELKAKLDFLCRTLNLSDSLRDKAWLLISKIPSDEISQDPRKENFMFACSLWIASKQETSSNSNANGANLTLLLRETKINLMEFFEPLRHFIGALKLGQEMEDYLKRLEKKFVVIYLLYAKYQRLMSDLIHTAMTDEQINSLTGPSSHKGITLSPQFIQCFGWNLFLVCKSRLLNDPPDLVNALHLLLCCVNLVIQHVPSHLLKFSMTQFSLPSSQFESNPANPSISTLASLAATVNPLAYLCQLSNTNYEEVQHMETVTFLPFVKLLCNSNTLKGFKPNSQDATTKSSYFAILEGQNAALNYESLMKEYEVYYYKDGDLDERFYTTMNLEFLGTPSKINLQTKSYYNIKQSGFNPDKMETTESHLLDPSNLASHDGNQTTSIHSLLPPMPQFQIGRAHV